MLTMGSNFRCTYLLVLSSFAALVEFEKVLANPKSSRNGDADLGSPMAWTGS